jgi:hypothetical protein
MALKAGCGGPGLEAGWLRGDYGSRCGSRAAVRWTALEAFGHSPYDEQPLQNWRGQGESDCLIKTKHCDGP